jgi:hypothetical protein
MTWLAPALLGVAAVAGVATVVAHLLARRRPRAVPWATARFLPVGELDARTLTRRPRDPWLLALRLLVLALLGAGAAQPVPGGERAAVRRLLLLDARTARAPRDSALATLAPRDLVLAFDTTATLAEAATVARDTVRRAGGVRSRLGGALVTLARVRDSLLRDVDSLDVTLLSPLDAALVDAGTPALRALVPQAMRVVRAPSRDLPGDTTRAAVRTVADGDDPVAAALSSLGTLPGGARVVVRRSTDADSAPASGTTLVRWPAAARATTLDAIRLDDGTTWVAPLARLPLGDTTGAHVVARWRDGTPAAVERLTAAGACLRTVGVGVPEAGDVTLTVEGRRTIASLVAPCDAPRPTLDAATIAALERAPAALPLAARAALVTTERSRWAPWLVGAAVLLALLEPLLRGRLAATPRADG